MIVFKNLREFAGFLQDQLPGRIEAGKQAGLHAAGELWADEMRGELGTYQAGDAGFEDWSPLAASTIQDKIEGGFPVPSPLDRTGAMKASIGHTVEGNEMVAGSTSIVAVYQNQGTSAKGVRYIRGISVEPGIPQREFVARGAFRKTEEAVNAIGAAVVKAMTDD